MDHATLNPERQEQARQYARIQRKIMLVNLCIAALYSLFWLFFGWSAALRNGLMLMTSNPWHLVAAFGVVFGAGITLLGFPIAFYSGFVLPHRFGLSNQRLADWFSDQGKSLLIGGLLGGLLLEIVYALLRSSPELWWLYVAATFLFFNVVMANLAPVLLFPIFYKFSPLDEEHADLVSRLMDLSDRAGAHVRGVYRFDMSRRTKAANAALAGLGNTRRILLGDTLLDEFPADEIETVLAHELGHHVHKDIPTGIIVESVLTLCGLYLVSLVLRWGAAAMGFDGPADIAAMPVLAILSGAYGLVTLPLGNAYARWRERRADEYALRITKNGAAYASALTRLANQNLAETDPEPWVEFLLYSHPALRKRITRARNWSE